MADKQDKKLKKEKKNKKEESEKKEKKSKKDKKRPREEEATNGHANGTNGVEKPAKKAKMQAIDNAQEWREKHSVTVCDVAKEYHPVGFCDSGLPEDVLQCTKNFENPTPIQAQSWPVIMSGKDLVGIAKTGSGKTYAFMLPCLAILKNTPKTSPTEPRGLVLAPTRELCSQIADVGQVAGKDCGMNVVLVYGGVNKNDQRIAIKAGCDVVVATPGRLKDLYQEGKSTLSLGKVSYAVLDEADRMLDMGFVPEVRDILGQTGKRQTVMFSATWPPTVQDLAVEFMKSPARITIGSEKLAANHAITQVVEVIEDLKKFARLNELLTKYHTYEQKNRVIVFGLYKKEVARLGNQLWSQGWKCVAIEGDMSQAARNAAYEEFKSGKVNLLIATDVAARGLDIKGVEYVINYSFPLTAEDYVHRIGRTGRAGADGFAHTFFTPQRDRSLGPDLIRILQEAKQTVPKELEKFRNVAPKRMGGAERNPHVTKDGGFKGLPQVQAEVFSDSD